LIYTSSYFFWAAATDFWKPAKAELALSRALYASFFSFFASATNFLLAETTYSYFLSSSFFRIATFLSLWRSSLAFLTSS